MGIFYSVTEKQVYEVRKKIFAEKGIPLLLNHGFEKSPFTGACFGKYNNRFQIYDFCRLTNDSMLQNITEHIIQGDKWIQISLNIFQLENTIKYLQQLINVDGIKFSLPPHSISNMRLHVDDYKGIPLLNYDSMFKNHKLNSYWTRWGLEKSVKKLENRIVVDLTNFEKYVFRWHKLYKPICTTIEGDIIGLKNMTINERLEKTRLTKNFYDSKIKNKNYAANILKWLEVDELEIKNILKL